MSSEVFIPTYLYIKQHTITGKLYFGKTIQNPETYIGSGLHWKSHIRKHGRKYISTLWYELFINKDELINFALEFSTRMNIVESDSWLNLQNENGLDGWTAGQPKSEQTKLNMRKPKTIKRILTDDHKQKLCKPKSQSTKEKLGRKVTCPHCGKVGGISAMTRYHFSNCNQAA